MWTLTKIRVLKPNLRYLESRHSYITEKAFHWNSICVYVCEYVFMCVHRCIYLYVYIHTHMCICVCFYVCHVCVCIYVCVHVEYFCICVLCVMCVCRWRSAYMHKCLYGYMFVYMCVHFVFTLIAVARKQVKTFICWQDCPSFPGTLYVDQVDLRSPASSSWKLGLKVCTIPNSSSLLPLN